MQCGLYASYFSCNDEPSRTLSLGAIMSAYASCFRIFDINRPSFHAGSTTCWPDDSDSCVSLSSHFMFFFFCLTFFFSLFIRVCITEGALVSRGYVSVCAATWPLLCLVFLWLPLAFKNFLLYVFFFRLWTILFRFLMIKKLKLAELTKYFVCTRVI